MKNRKAVALFASILLTASPAFALQVVQPVEGANSFIKVSAKELTRLAVENGKIQTVIVTEGDLALQKDEDRGQIFIRPNVLDKPINLRLITSAGSTYSLILQAVDIPQEDILIKDSAIAAALEAQANAASRDDPYQKRIRDLVVGMASEASDTRFMPREVNREVALWEDSRFVLLETYNHAGLNGDKYQLTNIGAAPLRLAEQELYRRGVVAVAIESLSLDPGQSTFVYVVRGE